MKKIGFIGLGRMGQAICHKLLAAGNTLYINNRTQNKSIELISLGANWCDSAAEVFKNAEVIFLCLSDEKITERLLDNVDPEVVDYFRAGSIVIDTGTISPASAERNNENCNQKNVIYVSCPVSGGIEGANSGTLASIISAPDPVKEKVHSIVSCFTNKVTWVNTHQEAQKLKILNNLAESINLLGAIEVLHIALKHGLKIEDLNSVLTTCRGRSAYMEVALKFLISNQSSSGVSLAVRCKDLSLSKLLIDDGHNDEDHDYTISRTVSMIYERVKNRFGSEEDQCEYFNFLHKDAIN